MSGYLKPREEAILLCLLQGRELNGVEIRDRIYKASSRRVGFPAGSLYPTLAFLRDQGFIQSYDNETGKGHRVYHRITNEGRQALRLVDSYRAKLRG